MRVLAQPLQGVTIALPESRYGEELAAAFERAGAQVRRRPLVTEELLEDASGIHVFIELAVSGKFDIVIFMTGIGVNLILREAQAIGRRESFVEALSKTLVVSRGSKSTAALRKANIRIDWIPASATSEGIIELLSGFDLSGRRIALQLYGAPNPLVSGALAACGAEVLPISVYSYKPASSASDVEAFVREIVAGEVDVIVFTSAPQVRALFEIAASTGLSNALMEALDGRTQVASIGEVTSRALEGFGVRPGITPDEPKMGAMVKAVCTTRSS